MKPVFHYLSNGQFLNMTQRDMEAALKYDGVSWGFEVSEGVRPADPFIPDRFLPVRRTIKDKSLNRTGIVLPVGTIISAYPVMNKEFYERTESAENSYISGAQNSLPISGDTNAGEIAVGIGYDSTALTSDVDNNLQGYGDKINLAGTIANGGVLVKDSYTDYDEEIGRVKADGSLIDKASDTYTRIPNIPIGVVTSHVVIDDRGAFLNFAENKFQRFSDMLTDWFVGVPYVVDSDFSASVNGSGVQTLSSAYQKCYDLGLPFLYASSFNDLMIGNWIKSDQNGKYTPEYTGTQLSSGSYSVNKTTQTVGKLVSIDNKFPKDLNELVMVYPNSQVGGLGTYGLPHQLFVLVYWVLRQKNGSAPTYTQIIDAVNSGKFGMARINLHIS